MQHLSSLALALKSGSLAARGKLRALRASWQQWRSRAPAPFSLHSTVQHKLDDAVARLVLSPARRSDAMPRGDNLDRKWLHLRAQQLGLTTTTVDRSGQWGQVYMSKPAGWVFAADRPVQAAPSQGQARSRARASRRERMEAWTTECENCGEELDAYTALYHHSGMGPLCEECVNDDEELEGLKWEPKASFWY